MTITLPLPPKELHPNARVHWMVKAKQTLSYRTTARWVAYEVLNPIGFHGKSRPYWKAATVQATFYFKVNRRRDADGLLSSLKAAFDGLADAGVIADDSGLTHLPVIVKVDAKNPRVELEIMQK